MLSRGAADPLMPSNSVSSASKVLYYDASVPLKEITLTNNSAQTVYPILSDANSRMGPGSPLPIYDPYDGLNQEFRGYVGYASGGKNYLGLRAHEQITINIPLVFWDGGRIDIATSGVNMIPKSPTAPNPFHYHDTNADGTPTARYAVPAIGPAATKGLVMWYHGKTAEGSAPDAPSQLIEMTFRDAYLGTLSTSKFIPQSEKQALINYDVSYVDSILLPVAMEAANVPIPIPNNTQPSISKAYGWTGAKLTIPQMQDAIRAFTSGNPTVNGLGQYFDGKGYDKYHFPNEAVSGIKLPAGQNLIGHSPLRNVRSSYNNNQYMLVSGGTTNIEYFSGGVTNSTTTMKVNDPNVLKQLKPGMVVTSQGPTVDLRPGTTIAQIEPSKGLVLLNQPAIASATLDVYTFTRPVKDYVATKLTNLWYSWADYYVANHQVANVNHVVGGTKAGNRVITFNAPVTATLVPGMTVTGPGIPAGTTISAIASDQMSVNLSKLATSTQSNAGYSFGTPQPIARSSEVQPFKLDFSAQSKDTADKFASALYAVMSAMSTIPTIPGQGTQSTQLMFNVLGCNVGFIPGVVPAGHGVPVISNEIRDDTKSILRGVYDFRVVPESTGKWYPNPATATPGADVNGAPANYNVYNLNPFVWFVHVKLGLSGYGFSVDDDVADVGANGATQLQVSIGGLNGLSNHDEWTWGAPFGSVTGKGQINKTTAPNRITGLDPLLLAQLNGEDPNVGPGALVKGQGVAAGTRVVSIDWGNHSVILDHDLLPNQTPDTYTYTFAGSQTLQGIHRKPVVQR